MRGKRKILIIISSVLIFFGILIILDRIILPNQINKNYVIALEEKQNKLEEETKKEEEANSFKSNVPTEKKDKAIYYVGQFMGHINKGEFENAYNCLNERFKALNFQNIELFKQYCNNQYTDFKTISLLQYKINDDIIIAQMQLTSLNNGTNIIQFFTIRELDSKTGKFEISFGI